MEDDRTTYLQAREDHVERQDLKPEQSEESDQEESCSRSDEIQDRTITCFHQLMKYAKDRNLPMFVHRRKTEMAFYNLINSSFD